MRWVQSAAGVRSVDRQLIDTIGIPSVVLMDHAGRAVAEAIRAFAFRKGISAPRVQVLCGPGNNGGDGYVVARHLALAGVIVRALPAFPPVSPDCTIFAGVCERLDLIGELPAPDVLVDAVFGNGQRAGSADPGWARWSAALHIALDVPTGVDADSGAVFGAAPDRIDHVVTIGRAKPFLFGGAWMERWSGSWECVDIGFGDRGAPDALLCTEESVPALSATANKWDRGHVGVVAGSFATAGAAVLCSRAALRAGAGLVTLFASPDMIPRLAGLPAEVMLAAGPFEARGLNAVVVGPGLGRARDAEVRQIWQTCTLPAVYDADALRTEGLGEPAGLRIITPHAGEAAAWLGAEWRALEADRFGTIRRLRGPRVAAVLKGACPLVSGDPPVVFEGRCPALGTAGSGDVLAGLAAALLARVRPTDRDGAERVARIAVSAHLAAGRTLRVGAFASEIADGLPAALEHLRHEGTVLKESS